MRVTLLATIAAALACAAPAAARNGALTDDALFGADGYRIAHYRGPVHAPPAGVGRIAPEAAVALAESRAALFIDVMPREPGVAHATIPGAHWFPEAGRGALSDGVADWLARGVARLAHGDRNRMIVAFCAADCWMSWNVARRLRAIGYRNVWWLAEGTDGWRDLGLQLTPARAEP